MIRLTHLKKTFHSQCALNDVSLHIKKGDIFGIIGKSGAGKSTLLRCINLLERPDSGDVSIDGESITHFSDAQLRQARHKTAMIFQHFNLLHAKTVYDNIALPMRIQGLGESIIDDKISELLPLVGLSDKKNAYPAQLSGGQKQRVAIARALSCAPKILLCDEATSALDPETTESILALLKTINERYGITMVLITHEMDVVKRICHRMAVMAGGKLVEEMTLSDVFSHKNSLARKLLYAQLSPPLPPCLTSQLSDTPNDHPVLRIFFEGEGATIPFISVASRELHIDINILLANLDRFDTITCGVLVVELTAEHTLLHAFLARCKQHHLSVEILGYVTHHAV